MLTEPWRILRHEELSYLLCLVCNSIDPDPDAVAMKRCRACGLTLPALPPAYTAEEHRRERAFALARRGRAIYPKRTPPNDSRTT
jgi:hypothetical protein